MAQVIPLQPLPSQSVTVLLGQQACRIEVAQKNTGMFVNLYVSDALMIGGVVAENRNRIVRSVYLGFVGDLAFVDTQGTSDPTYDLIGERYFLVYYPADELVDAAT